MSFKKFDQEELDSIIETIKSDLKYNEPGRKELSDENIRRALFKHVIRELYSSDRFLSHEKEDDGRMGTFIKGYVRDVWSYLDEAYDLIHDQRYDTKSIREDKIESIVNDEKEN